MIDLRFTWTLQTLQYLQDLLENLCPFSTMWQTGSTVVHRVFKGVVQEGTVHTDGQLR